MPALAVDRSGGVSLWSQVQADLRRRAAEGEFDAAFPGENALVAQYAVSRNTVREALRALRADGVVTAERGRAPRLLRAPGITQPVGALYSLFASVEAAGMVQGSMVRRLEVTADGVVAARLGLEESTPLLHLERLRLADGEPLALDRVWLPADLAAPLLDADFGRTSLYDELAARCGVHVRTGTEEFRAQMPTAGERTLLHCPPGTATFAVTRTGWSDDRCVEWRRTAVRGDRFVFRTDVSTNRYEILLAAPVTPGPGA